MRYEKYLFVGEEPDIDESKSTEIVPGIFFSPTGLTENESNLTLERLHVIEGCWLALVELFELENIRLCCTAMTVFFTIPELPNADVTEEIQSPLLDRDLLMNEKNCDVVGAIIDLLKDRDKWNHKVVSQLI